MVKKACFVGLHYDMGAEVGGKLFARYSGQVQRMIVKVRVHSSTKIRQITPKKTDFEKDLYTK